MYNLRQAVDSYHDPSYYYGSLTTGNFRDDTPLSNIAFRHHTYFPESATFLASNRNRQPFPSTRNMSVDCLLNDDVATTVVENPNCEALLDEAVGNLHVRELSPSSKMQQIPELGHRVSFYGSPQRQQCTTDFTQRYNSPVASVHPYSPNKEIFNASTTSHDTTLNSSSAHLPTNTTHFTPENTDVGGDLMKEEQQLEILAPLKSADAARQYSGLLGYQDRPPPLYGTTPIPPPVNQTYYAYVLQSPEGLDSSSTYLDMDR